MSKSIIVTPLSQALVVEDDPALHELLGTALQREGFRTSYATHRAAALALLRSIELDMVIADVGLPDGSGLEVAHRAAEMGIPSIVMSGGGAPLHGLAAASFLAKPLRLDRLRQEIRRIKPRLM